MNFKVGDKVKLKESIQDGLKYGENQIPFFNEMRFSGRTTIKSIDNQGDMFLNDVLPNFYHPDMLVKELDISEIIDRNYQATVRRGLINENTPIYDFLRKINEEYKELYCSYIDPLIHNDELGFDPKELADIALVCFAMATHYNIDLLKVMEQKTIFNEQRPD